MFRRQTKMAACSQWEGEKVEEKNSVYITSINSSNSSKWQQRNIQYTV